MKKLLAISIMLTVSLANAASKLDEGLDSLKKKDYVVAIEILEPLAISGNNTAQYLLGDLFTIKGTEVEDYEKGVRFYKLAAHGGNEIAQHDLGVLYSNGEGVLQDFSEAVKWYKLAAAHGFAPSQNNLGNMYFNGRGVAQDYVKAHMWLNLSASTGFNSDWVNNRNEVAKKMTARQIAEAQKLARECLARKYKGC